MGCGPATGAQLALRGGDDGEGDETRQRRAYVVVDTDAIICCIQNTTEINGASREGERGEYLKGHETMHPRRTSGNWLRTNK
jgi:hypothetical protein